MNAKQAYNTSFENENIVNYVEKEISKEVEKSAKAGNYYAKVYVHFPDYIDCTKMKHKTIQQLRDTLNKVLKRGRPNQLKKLQKAYHGKRLKMWWASYAQFENLQISELKEMEGVGNRMKGGHRRNAIYNAFHRIIFRSKNARQIDPTQKQEWRKTFEIQVFGELKRIAQINFLDILKKGKHFKQAKRITEASNER